MKNIHGFREINLPKISMVSLLEIDRPNLINGKITLNWRSILKTKLEHVPPTQFAWQLENSSIPCEYRTQAVNTVAKNSLRGVANSVLTANDNAYVYYSGTSIADQPVWFDVGSGKYVLHPHWVNYFCKVA